MGNELVCFSFLLLLLLALHSPGNAAREREDADGVNVLRIASMDLAQQTEDVKHAYAHHHGHSSSSHMGMGKADIDNSMKLFFRMKDIHVGKKMPFDFSNVGHSIAIQFLSKEEADSIPFSSEALPQLLRFFSFSPDSPQAMAMKETLSRCESDAPPGEIVYCATSSESLLDSARSIFGSDSQVGVLRTSQIANSSLLYQNFTILELKDVSAPKMIACHVMTYPYKVYYCHSQLTENKVFRVSLSSDKGDRVDAVSVCHMDTSTWDPSHVSFRLLGTKPGTSEVCHVFPAYDLVLVPILSTF